MALFIRDRSVSKHCDKRYQCRISIATKWIKNFCLFSLSLYREWSASFLMSIFRCEKASMQVRHECIVFTVQLIQLCVNSVCPGLDSRTFREAGIKTWLDLLQTLNILSHVLLIGLQTTKVRLIRRMLQGQRLSQGHYLCKIFFITNEIQ